MTKGTIEFDLSTPEGRVAMNLCLNSQKMVSALWDIREAMFRDIGNTAKLKVIQGYIGEISHLIEQ